MTPSEKRAKDILERDGWEVINSGWPDFIAIKKDGTLKFVEVKGHKDRLHGNQLRVHEILRTLGLEVEVMQFGTPGLEPVPLPKGYCPHCGEVVYIRTNGIPFQHAQNNPDGKEICPQEPGEFVIDSSDGSTYWKSRAYDYPVTMLSEGN